MKCPHCLENFFEGWKGLYYQERGPSWVGSIADRDGRWLLEYCTCPSCKRVIIQLRQEKEEPAADGSLAMTFTTSYTQLVRPRNISRAPLPEEVPLEFAKDYEEACLVLSDSPKASAALSRRCLQNLLREKGGTMKKDLSTQIQDVLDSRTLPSYLAEAIDAVRNIGNFAAHPIKSTNIGEIIDVEPGEAEWNLDVLEGLFDFYFVQPNKLKGKKEKLNKKLEDAGKPPMKTSEA